MAADCIPDFHAASLAADKQRFASRRQKAIPKNEYVD
jgi:hypothetical protein